MDFNLTYLISAIDLLPIAFFVASAILGFLLGWAIFSQYKEKFTSLEKQYSTLKDSMDRLVTEYSNYKVSVDNSLAAKDEEMLKLNQLLRQKQNTSDPKLEKAYKSLEENYSKLTHENDRLKSSVIKKKDAVKLINSLSEKLEQSQIKLKKQDSLLMKAKKESFPRDNSAEIKTYKKQIDRLKTKLERSEKEKPSLEIEELVLINKKLKKKLKKYKSKKKNMFRPKAEKIEYVETLDVKKLMELIESGKLLKRRKTSILSKNGRK